jgi:hypothetical protein
MGKVVNIEDYRKETLDQIWDRIESIRNVIHAVMQDRRSTVLDFERVQLLSPLKDYLVNKAYARIQSSAR